MDVSDVGLLNSIVPINVKQNCTKVILPKNYDFSKYESLLLRFLLIYYEHQTKLVTELYIVFLKLEKTKKRIGKKTFFFIQLIKYSKEKHHKN